MKNREKLRFFLPPWQTAERPSRVIQDFVWHGVWQEKLADDDEAIYYSPLQQVLIPRQWNTFYIFYTL